MKDLLLLTGIVAFAVGVSFSTFVSVPPATILFLALLSIGFFFTWFFGKRDWYLFPMLVLLGIAIGIARVELIRDTLQTSFVPLIDTKVSLEGTVVADPDVRESTQRLVVRTHSGSEDSRVLVVAPRYPAYHHGDILTIRGKLTYPQAFETDGGRTFAYDSFLAKDGIFSMMKFAQVEKTGESGNLLVRIQKSLYDVKHAFAKGLENALPEPHASLAGGLLVGGKQGIGKALLEDFTIAGLLPIIVLSGYNVMIVAQGILIGFSFLRKRTALTLAVVTIALFVLSAGGGSSAIRAGLMAGLALFARATGRTYDALRILLFVFVLMLLWNPLQLVYDPGFQFSFAATAGLILLSPLLELRLMWIRSVFLREVVATTLSAQLFVLPLLLYQTGNLSLVAVPANILELPLIPFTMLFSFVAGLTGLLSPTVAVYVGLPAYLLLSYVIAVAQFMASLPLARIILPSFSFIFVLLMYGAIYWLVLRLQKTKRSPST